MTDALPTLAPHDLRHRHAQIRDRLRIIGERHALPVDSMYVRGVLKVEQWTDTHLFRADQVLLADARARGHVRGPQPSDARARKECMYYRHLGIEIERALGCRKLMDDECYVVARIITGMETGEYEHEQALTAVWQIQQIYRFEAGKMRWREYG